MSYVRPAAIPADMGGDARMRGILHLLEMAPLGPGQKALDVGMGAGQISVWLAQKGLAVTGTGLEMDSYATVAGIEMVPCAADRMPFPDGSFDVVVMSHVLEHCPNAASVLAEVRRVLRNGGWLLVFVPPPSSEICAGHVSGGWNVGQLLYVLLLAGFSVRDGRFIEWSGSVGAFVTKDEDLRLPPLRGDRGDLRILTDAGLLPRPIQTRDGFNDGFCGDIGALNWDAEQLRKLRPLAPVKERLLWSVLRMIPWPSRFATILFRVARTMQKVRRINPPALT